MPMQRVFNKYKEATLLYSGGKDSLVCLLLARPWWDRMNVVFIDTGRYFPEVYEHMEKVKSLVPHFEVVPSGQPLYHMVYGLPVDVVPTKYTALGDYFWGKGGVRVCSRFDCCMANVWRPTEAYLRKAMPECVIRGDRGVERVVSQSDANGVHFEFPIFDWTTKQVHAYLRADQSGLVQERHFLEAGSSLNCVTCTAHFKDQKQQLPYMRKHHPEIVEQRMMFYKDYKRAVEEEMAELGGIE